MSQEDVINTQPSSSTTVTQKIPPPGPMKGVPPGLEQMTTIDKFTARQVVDIGEVVIGFEARNKYRICDSSNQQVFWAYEESSFCHRCCWGTKRGFILHITGKNQKDVLTLERKFRCCAGNPLCADGCCMYPIDIKDSSGKKIGMTRSRQYCFYPHLGIFDKDDELLYDINGPFCTIQGPCCQGDVVFPITKASDGTEVGKVTKIYAGALREFFTDSELFGVQFPMDLDVTHKALMLGALFLVDFAIFEKLKNNK